MYNSTLINENDTNWASLVRNLLFNLGFGHAWYQQTIGNVNNFKILCKQRLYDQCKQNWISDFNTKSSCIFYKQVIENCFHVDVKSEIIVKKHRVALRRFRANNFKLPVVVMGGGRQNVP